ncbi:MarR family transcriptional regulator (plasmid) [Streptomyces sp. NBC_00445]|uniref:MarR family transcriptional regulator n=1 Tax=Streptomyces sp. NBC_00445 TaxID=2975745 RepID=UPI002E1E521B
MGGPAVRQADTDANLDSRTVGNLVHLDAFAHHGLGGSRLAILAALADADGQTSTELRSSASASRPTVHRQLAKLKTLGLVIRQGELNNLARARLGRRRPALP